MAFVFSIVVFFIDHYCAGVSSKHCLSFFFSLIVNVRPLFVFDLLFNLFRIALWPSVGEELSHWLFTCAVFILASS